ncbi:MBL fold metallo-hydrolase [Bacteroides sp. OttesenSCG-928-J23]|nr:MBL fold metallo-hydrolase [Bacteroides sp. OttesenSCG-928-J23]
MDVLKITIMPVGILGTNCYLLSSGEKNCAVIDPGGQADKIKAQLEERGLTPRMILLTHGHHDHFGGLKKLLEYFPVPFYIGKDDAEMLTDDERNRAHFWGLKPEEYHIEGVTPLEDGQELMLDELTIKVMNTPGHTKGGVCYLVGDVIFSGDTLFRDDIGRCDLYGGDFAVMRQSLQKLRDLPGDYTVYPGHGDSTELARERQYNHYMKELSAL